MPPGEPAGTSTSVFGPGRLSMAPVGLGMLSTGGYFGDLKSFYCPTGGVYDRDINRQSCGQGSWIGWIHTSLKDIKTIGGGDPENLTHGDFRSLYGKSSGVYDNWAYAKWKANGLLPTGVTGPLYSLALGSSYAYRNQPTVKAYGALETYENGWAFGGSGTQGHPARPKHVFSLTDSIGCFRKTQKQLGGATVVTDRFAQPDQNDLIPGDGMFAHREGYNMLYGDWSARWYGDPQQKWIWIANRPLKDSEYPFNVSTVDSPNAWATRDPIRLSTVIQAWLYFDQDAGVTTFRDPQLSGFKDVHPDSTTPSITWSPF